MGGTGNIKGIETNGNLASNCVQGGGNSQRQVRRKKGRQVDLT